MSEAFSFGDSMSGSLRGGMSPQMQRQLSMGNGSLLSDCEISTDDNNSMPNKRSMENEAKSGISDTQYVRFWRCVLLIILLGAGAMISVLSARALRQEEDEDIDTKYRLFVDTIQDITSFHIDNLQQVYSSFSESITASKENEFPFVTMPHFELLGENARKLGDVELIAFVPLVAAEQLPQWYNYSVTHQDWITKSRQVLQSQSLEDSGEDIFFVEGNIVPVIYERDPETQEVVRASGEGPFAPIWQVSPPPFDSGLVINYNMFSEPWVQPVWEAIRQTEEPLWTEIFNHQKLADTAISEADHKRFHDEHVEGVNGVSPYDHPHCTYVQPVYSTLNNRSSEISGIVVAVVTWDTYLSHLLPDGINGITAVLRSSCGAVFTYVIRGQKSKFLGPGDQHDRDYDHTKIVVPLTQYSSPETINIAGHCSYEFHVYSSSEFVGGNSDSTARQAALIVAAIFVTLCMIFLIYDVVVTRRNIRMADLAEKSNAILASLFPSNVRERLFEDHTAKIEQQKKGNVEESNRRSLIMPNKLRNYLKSGDQEEEKDKTTDVKTKQRASELFAFKTKPIADLFPETTIMFGDIAGFTAWSSVREPSQVFILLETLYHAFDEIAHRRRVFKVETVGDCYVAVAGLPDPQKDHAVIMARFASDCLHRAQSLTRRLEVNLGPDTAELAMRIGLHSGPVTAGVLRGEKSRFQLFGDTMNTASRMESTGVPNDIQVSEETAELLVVAGKEHWLSPREDQVHAKGKGILQTYWLDVNTGGRTMDTQSTGYSDDNTEFQEDQRPRMANWASSVALEDMDVDVRDIFDPRTVRLIDWNVDVLVRLLRLVVARRQVAVDNEDSFAHPDEDVYHKRAPVIDEVREIIKLPDFDDKNSWQDDESEVELSEEVIEQLHDLVCNIAAIYRENAFHNFEHASHVTMSVTKLLSRIVAPSDLDLAPGKESQMLHDHTYGITSDPLTQFACVFSALIHDVDHSGVPNTQLVKEDTELAKFYKNKSVAEQNSVDLAWNLLMDDNYADLRATIYSTDEELRRFRQLIVNSVMATDIVDKELKGLRNVRWDRAFAETPQIESAADDRNRKATIVIEHLIQASDVAHTMQHWHIYRKWNQRFFEECYFNYITGRAENNPVEGWYKGELGFFDFYIIPLAKKLKDCGVFGVSSDEYLNYAEKNRREWEERGEEIVAEMFQATAGKYEAMEASTDIEEEQEEQCLE